MVRMLRPTTAAKSAVARIVPNPFMVTQFGGALLQQEAGGGEFGVLCGKAGFNVRQGFECYKVIIIVVGHSSFPSARLV